MEAIDKKRARLDKKNLARRQYSQESRSAIFIKEYIHAKHQEIYEEAVAFYNHVNNLYPQKGDLRKTQEFKAMKLGMTFVAKQRKNLRQVYLPISTTDEHIFTVISTTDSTTEQAETFPSTVDSTTEQAETFPSTVDSTTEQAETFPSTVDSTTEQAETFPSTVDSTTEQAETFPSTTEPKIMQLRIPLMSPHQITTTTTTTVLEENSLTTLCDELQPTLDEEIPEEVYNEILAGLRQDPDLAKLMEEIEKDNDINEIIEEFEQDIDIDLPDIDDRLERELSNWEAW